MKFKYKIKGLGNIKEAEIDIAPFTLIAGENNTGKSFTTRSIYCILEALNYDHIFNVFLKLHDKIKNKYFQFVNTLNNSAKIDKEFIIFFNTTFWELLQKIMIEIKLNNEDVLNVFIDDLKKI